MDRTVFNKIHYKPTFSSISGDPRPEYGITGTSGLEGTDAVPLLLLDISLLNKNRYSIIINRNTTIVMPLIIFLICFRSFIDFFSGLPTYSRIRMGADDFEMAPHLEDSLRYKQKWPEEKKLIGLYRFLRMRDRGTLKSEDRKQKQQT